MEVREEATGSKEYLQIMKGKRTKRPRQACSLALTMASSSSSVAEEGGGVSENSGGFDDRATTTASPTNSGEFTGGGGGEEEDNDMANCLILLAQGSRPIVPSNYKAGSYVYQCKTCDRCFPSFQALGGHRASHKKPKAAATGEFETKKLPPLVLIHENGGGDQTDRDRTALSLQIPSRVSAGNSNNKSRVHECSVCGAEFSSGQALGGHMRRHRTISMAATTTSPDHDDHSQQGKKSPRNNILALDLNLPAAAEDDDHRRETKFQQVIVFSAAPSLVDCHY